MITRRDSFAREWPLGGFGLAAHFSRFGLLNAYAPSSGDYRALVCVFLFGGNDSNNMIVPTDTKILRRVHRRSGRIWRLPPRL